MVELTGFTLFKTPKGWQLSTSIQSEAGWFVRRVDEEIANRVLSAIPTELLPDMDFTPPKYELPTPAKFETVKPELKVELPKPNRFTRGPNATTGRLF
jgi:hypothetical protein